MEILDHFAGWIERLCADTRAARLQVRRSYFRNQPLKRSAKQIFTEGSPHFVEAELRVFLQKRPEPWICEGIEQITHADVALAISFARERQHGVGSRFDPAVNQACEMHAEKWKFRIGNRID